MLRVLIVDDQKTMRMIVRGLLKKMGITDVTEAESAAQVLKLLRDPGAGQFNVIISDLHMADGSGIDLCNQIRLDKVLRARRIPILLLTGESDSMLLDVARQVGVAKVLKKPVSIAELKAAIRAVIGVDVAMTSGMVDA
jgi:two-component system, chemotaxis family, chemotaxis protein CheY